MRDRAERLVQEHVTGPIQALVISFDRPDISGHDLAALRKVRKPGVIRVVDMLLVEKAEDGTVASTMHEGAPHKAERARLGGLVASLIGLEAGDHGGAAAPVDTVELLVSQRDYGMSADQLAELTDSIPSGSAAAILIIEHHWTMRLCDAIDKTGGRLLLQAMLRADLVAEIGPDLKARLEAEEALEAAEAVKLAAAMEVAQILAESDLIADAAMAETADVVAAALAIGDSAEEDAAEALVASGLIEAEAATRAAAAVADALAIEDAASEEAWVSVEATQDFKAAVAIEAMHALYIAGIVDSQAAQEAIDALVAADIIEADDAGAALEAVLSSLVDSYQVDRRWR